MATEQEKTTHLARMLGLATVGMTLGIWELVEESATTLTPIIGTQLIGEIEKQLGLEIAGEKPEDLFVELGRIFVDEYGFASEAKVVSADKTIRVTFKNAVGSPEFAMLKERGVEKLFSHPFMCTGVAALSRMGTQSPRKCRNRQGYQHPDNFIRATLDCT